MVVHNKTFIPAKYALKNGLLRLRENPTFLAEPVKVKMSHLVYRELKIVRYRFLRVLVVICEFLLYSLIPID